jgi:hypothetical protein
MSRIGLAELLRHAAEELCQLAESFCQADELPECAVKPLKRVKNGQTQLPKLPGGHGGIECC